MGDAAENEVAQKMASFIAPKQIFKETSRAGEKDKISGFSLVRLLIERITIDRRLTRVISPEMNDPFLDKTHGP